MGEKREPHEEPKEAETETHYNFGEAMREVEAAVTSLVEQLKEKIETGEEYSALLSDDAGGRIPTLVLEKIFREKSPKKIRTYFLGGGSTAGHKHQDQEKYEQLTKYLGTMDLGDKKLLIVTQFISSGETLDKIGVALKDIGVTHFDIASMYVGRDKAIEPLKKYFQETFGAELMIGKGEWAPGNDFMANYHTSISGIKSQKDPYSPMPIKVGKQEEINQSREDIALMAQKIIKKVWPES